MDLQDIQKKLGNGEIPAEDAKQPSDIQNPQQSQAKTLDIDEFIVVLKAMNSQKRHITTAPTNVPLNFWQQFEFYDSGGTRRLYVYINGTWRYVALT